MVINGEFDVALKPIDSTLRGKEGVALGRMSIDKRFHGELEASSRGEMLSVRTPIEGSAGYVAIEQVEGKLGNKAGSFVLQHFGIMAGGNNRLVLEVVPNSGTGDLVALSGTMTIEIRDGKHFYEFEYTV